MKRYLAYSTGLHCLCFSLVFFWPSPKPPQFYGIDFLGGSAGAGLGGGGSPAPAAKRNIRATVEPPAPVRAKPIPEEPNSARDKERLLIHEKKEAAKSKRAQKKVVPPPTRTIQSKKKLPPSEKPVPEAVSKEKGVEGGTGTGVNLVIGGSAAGAGAGPGSGSGFGGGGGGGFGPRFPYTWYINLLYRKLWESWDSRNAGTKECTMAFSIRRDGSAADIKVNESSGDKVFDHLAQRAVQNAAPFPPLPDGFPDPELRVVVRFKLE